jgi:peptide deformylase
MALLNLITAPDVFLKQRSVDVVHFDADTKALMDDMKATMYHHNGVGLAAVQVGVLKNIIVIDMHDLRTEDEMVYDEDLFPLFLVNPKITHSSSEKILASEGCLSLPEQSIELPRAEKVSVSYKDYHNQDKILHADGWLARAIQHEMDHLLGKLLIDYVSFSKRDLINRRLTKLKNSKNL